MPLVFLDTNLLIVLIVGRTDRTFLGSHKRTMDYGSSDFEFIEALVAAYDGIVTTSHVLTEASNLLRQIGNPARDLIQHEFREFILSCEERSIPSREGCGHEQFIALGLTDSTILVTCEASGIGDGRVELLTADEPIYDRALSLGLPAELYA